MKDITVNTNVTVAMMKAWNWEKSVENIQGIYLNKYKTTSKQLIEELIRAKKNIGSKVGNPHGEYTWKQFCLDCFDGKPTQRTVDNWIYRHIEGEEAWASRIAKQPKEINIDSQFIKMFKDNKDGTYTIRVQVSEYDQLFEECCTL